MGISRKSLASIILTVMLISSLVCEPAQADDISYGALGKNRVPKKGKIGEPANDYTRGCTPGEHCSRGGK
ncbi:unnamed protein product [Amaranthus hypochondriacus]